MIEKLDIIRDSENCVDAFGDTHNVAGHKVINKINELVDAVNKQEQVIKILIDGLERLAKSQQELNTEITAIFIK